MRILFLALDTVLTDLKGDSVHVRELARAMAADGHQVLLLAAADGVDEAGVRTVVVQPGGNLAVLRAARRAARDFRPDAIYERRLSGKMAASLSALLGTPYFLEVNGLADLEMAMQGRRPRAGDVLREPVRKAFFRGARGVVAVSSGLRTALIKRYGLRPALVAVIPNGANVDLFQPRDRAASRNTLGLDPEVPLVGFVGNFAPWQGVADLINAMALLRHDKAGAYLVGGGQLEDELRAMARGKSLEHRVRFAGRVAYPDVPLHIGACDVCAAPFPGNERNRIAGLSPLKVFEYMACGRATVTTDVVEGAEDLSASGALVAVPPDNPHAFAEALDALLDDARLRSQMGERARRIVVERYGWRATAQAVAGFLQGRLSGG